MPPKAAYYSLYIYDMIYIMLVATRTVVGPLNTPFCNLDLLASACVCNRGRKALRTGVPKRSLAIVLAWPCQDDVAYHDV